VHQVGGFFYKTVVSPSVPELEFKLFRHLSQNGISQGLGWPRFRFVLMLYSIAKPEDQTNTESHVYCTVAGYTCAGLASSSRLPKAGGVLRAAI